jgi:outer membrane usher protein
LCWASLNRTAGFLIGASILPGAALAADGGVFPAIGLPIEHVAVIPAAGAAASATGIQERLLQVDINRQRLDEAVLVLEDRAGALYLWSRDIQRWRFQTPAAGTAIEYNGENYYPLSALSDVAHEYDPKQLTLRIEVRPEAFARTRLSTQYGSLGRTARSQPGGFFNYDLLFSHAPESTQRSGQFELGYFNRYGVGTSNFLAEQLGSHPRLTRLESTWTVDFPQKMQTLRLGDAINTPGAWGRSVRFGGIQFGTNRGTQPGFVSFPQQSVAGQAALPSTVDVFVNNALVSRQNVPPGPFSIGKLPVITGAGEVQLVVRDLLGREQIVTQPFYGSQSLLGKGLEDVSYELGFARENFGINSNDYGAWLGAATYRRGLSDAVTGEVHGEAMRDQATLGAGGDFLLPHFGTLNAYAAGSRSNGMRGGTLLLGLDRQARPWSFGARTQWASRSFTQVGFQAPQLPPAQVSSLNLSYAARRWGSVGIAYVGQRNRDQDDMRIATLSYSVSLGKLGSLAITALRNLTGEQSTTVFAMLNIPLSPASSLSLSAQSVRGSKGDQQTDYTTALQRNLPSGDGYGYQLQARSDGSSEASVGLQNRFGTYTAGIAQAQGSTATRLGVSGGAALLGGDVFWSRRIDQSFAVARIPDFPNVRILADNQPAGRTDADGNALIPRLRAYDRNVLAIDQRDLPLDAEIGSLKLEVFLPFRSGIDVEFPVKRSHGASFTVLLEDGRFLPVGASVQIIGNNAVHPVGYGGEAYVTGLGRSNHMLAVWNGRSCEFLVRFNPGADPLPDLGTFICKGILP